MDMVTCEQLLALVLGSKMLAVGIDLRVRVDQGHRNAAKMKVKGIVCADQGKVPLIQAWGRSRHRR